MTKLNARFVGIELYFENLEEGKVFYGKTLGFPVLDEAPGHYARFDTQPVFICLERKGSEPYPSRDKAVVFLEVPNLPQAVDSIGRERVVEMMPEAEGNRRPWAVVHDPEGYNIVLLEAVKTVASA